RCPAARRLAPANGRRGSPRWSWDRWRARRQWRARSAGAPRPASSLAVQAAQREESAFAPYAEQGRVADPLLCATLDQLVEYRAAQARFQPVSHKQVRIGLAGCGIVNDPERMIATGSHSIVNIGAEDELLLAT